MLFALARHAPSRVAERERLASAWDKSGRAAYAPTSSPQIAPPRWGAPLFYPDCLGAQWKESPVNDDNCEWCHKPLPFGHREGARFCRGNKCRNAYRHASNREALAELAALRAARDAA